MKPLEMCLAAYGLNALWQAPLSFLLAFGIVRVMRGRNAAWEHRIWVAALALEVIFPAASALPAAWVQRLETWVLHSGGKGVSEVSASVTAWRVAAGFRGHPVWVDLLAEAYTAVLLYAALQLLWRYRQTQVLQRGAEPLELKGAAAQVWASCCERFGIGPVTVAESGRIAGPLTLGIGRRWLLLPTGLVQTLGEDELWTVFAHECVHIRRRDFAKNLLYEALMLPLAWHPALWATRRRLVESRELVCDALAAQAAGPRKYARSLLRLAMLLVKAGPGEQFHAIGIFDANTLEERIMRLTQGAGQMSRVRRMVTVGVCGLATLGVCVPAWAWGVRASGTQEPAAVTQEGARVVRVQGDIMAGNLASRVNPVYPPEAKAQGVQGKVVLDAVIGTDGSLSSLRLVSGPPELAKAAWAAVTQWTWKPYLLNGNPTPVQTTITVNFQLNP